MNHRLLAGMFEATRLTNAGRLQEATATIQRTLGGAHAPEAGPADTRDAPIEGHFRVVDATSRLPPPRAAEAPPRGRHETPFHFRARSRPQPRTYERPAFWSRPITPGRIPDLVPDGARFLSGSYTNQAGTRPYKVYIPSCYRDQALPLVVMLHGCTQNPDDFAAGTRMNQFAETHSCLVVYPAQTSAANMSKCWNWFKEDDQQRDRGEPAIIAGITRQIAGTYKVDTRRVYVAGLSAGGAMAAIMAKTYPDLYAAAGIHSGPDHSAAHDLPSAFAAMQGSGIASAKQRGGGADPGARVVPMIVFHGDRDFTVRPSNGDQVAEQWDTTQSRARPHTRAGSKPRATIQRGQVPNGHAYTRVSYRVADGEPILEHWLIHGAGHAWSGGNPNGTYTDPQGPDATQEMLRFFHEHPQQA